MSLFSQRNTPPPSQLSYDVPDKVRRRVAAIVEQSTGHDSQQRFFRELEDLLLREYGSLCEAGNNAACRNKVRVIEHFLACSDEYALDFIEACFRPEIYALGPKGVDEINRVFREEGIGYELSKFIGGSDVPGWREFGGPTGKKQYPRIIRIDNQYVHANVVTPALELLNNPVLAVANREMLKAHSDHRSGQHEDAITACGSAFESVLKTICDQKEWPYDTDKDTCANLVEICRAKGLFPRFYTKLFENVGTVRNNLGDAHGRGPAPTHTVEAANAEHMLHMTAANVVLLCKLAGLE